MKRIITKEIFIEIETIRVTKKRSARKKSTEQAKSDDSGEVHSFVKSEARFEHRFDKHF